MKEIYHYKTIKGSSKGFYKEKGSKFIALAYPIESEERFKEIYIGVKKEYHDARHHCFAYRVYPENESVRSSDNGEPSGTAGKPILNQLYSSELLNLVVIVVRYFGGTKLGVSGLINAYKLATQDAITNADIKLIHISRNLRLEFKYPLMNDIMRIIKQEDLTIVDQDFQLDCMINIEVKKSVFETVYMRFNNLRGVNVKELKNS